MRLLNEVEGQTEEAFTNNLLRDHLVAFGYHSVSARILGNARQRAGRGGIKPWSSVKKDIVRHLREDEGCVITTMVDYYGLPASGGGAWPGRAEAGGRPFGEKATTIEHRLKSEIATEMGGNFDHRRFAPFVVMHEYEAVLFSDCEAFARSIGRKALAGSFQAIRDRFNSPEEINDSELTAPSKRLIGLIPNYEKPLYGVVGALEIGLDSIRRECPHFNEWLTTLERIPT